MENNTAEKNAEKRSPYWFRIINGKVRDLQQTADDTAPKRGDGWRKTYDPNGIYNGLPVEQLDENNCAMTDKVLVEKGIKEDHRGKWYDTAPDHIGNSIRISKLDEKPPEGYVKNEPLEDEETGQVERFQRWDDAEKEWVLDANKKEIAKKEMEINTLQSEISSRDWRVTKAARLGEELDVLYPGESAWYNTTVAKINRLESEVAQLKQSAA